MIHTGRGSRNSSQHGGFLSLSCQRHGRFSLYLSVWIHAPGRWFSKWETRYSFNELLCHLDAGCPLPSARRTLPPTKSKQHEEPVNVCWPRQTRCFEASGCVFERKVLRRLSKTCTTCIQHNLNLVFVRSTGLSTILLIEVGV